MTVSITRSSAAFQRPYCHCITASQTLTTALAAFANLPTTATVDNGLATTGTALLDGANDRIYLRRAGLWQLSAVTNWAASGAGKRSVRIDVNGTQVGSNVNDTFTGFFGDTHAANALVYTAVTTAYADVTLYQTSGGNLATTTTFRAVWLGTYL